MADPTDTTSTMRVYVPLSWDAYIEILRAEFERLRAEQSEGNTDGG